MIYRLEVAASRGQAAQGTRWEKRDPLALSGCCGVERGAGGRLSPRSRSARSPRGARTRRGRAVPQPLRAHAAPASRDSRAPPRPQPAGVRDTVRTAHA